MKGETKKIIAELEKVVGFKLQYDWRDHEQLSLNDHLNALREEWPP